MKSGGILILLLLTAFFSLQPASSLAQIGDLFKGFKEFLGGGELSEGKVIQGLKEALEIGTKNAIQLVSKRDGYYGNTRIRVPLPDSVQKVERLLRVAGYGAQVEAFELSMNRAAEQAAPEAKALFWDAIKEMTFDDASNILNGRDNEATLFLRGKTGIDLRRRLNPLFIRSWPGWALPVTIKTSTGSYVTSPLQKPFVSISINT